MGNSVLSISSNNRELQEPMLRGTQRENLIQFDSGASHPSKGQFEGSLKDREALIPEDLRIEQVKNRFLNKKAGRKSKMTTEELCAWETFSLGEITSMALSADENYLLAGTKQGKVSMIDLKTRRIVHVFKYKNRTRIWSISSSRDNIYFAFTEGDLIRLYDLQTKEEVCSLPHKGARAVVISNGNKEIISAGTDKSIRVFDFNTQKEIYCFENIHQDEIMSMTLTNDNKYIISGSDDGTVMITDLAKRQQVHQFKQAHEEAVTSIAVTKDNKWAISASLDKSLKIFNIETKEEVHHIKEAHNDEIYSIVFSKDDRYFISGAYDGSIKIFDWQTKKEISDLVDFHKSSILSLAILKDDTLLSGSWDMSIKMFKLETRHEQCLLGSVHSGAVNSVAFSKDNRYIVSGSDDCGVRVFDLKTRKLLRQFNTEGPINSVIISPNNQYIICASSYSIKVFNMQTEELVNNFQDAHKDTISSVVISNDDSLIISASQDGTVKIFNLHEGKEVYCLDAEASSYLIESIKSNFLGNLNSVWLTNDEKYIVLASEYGYILFYDLITKKRAYNISNAHAGQVTSVAVSSDNSYVVSASADKSIKVWNFETKQLIHHFKDAHQGKLCLSSRFMEKGTIKCVRICNDNKYFVSCSRDGSIKVWDFDLMQEIHHYENAHNDDILSIDLSSDDRYILSGSCDGSFKLFTLKAEIEGSRWVHGHEGSIFYLGVSEDDKYVVSASRDGAIKMFDIHSKEEVAHFHHGGSICDVEMSRHSHYLVTRGNEKDCYIKVFDLEGRKEDNCFSTENWSTGWWAIVTISSDGRFIAPITFSNSTMKVIDRETKQVLWQKSCHEGNHICISNNNKYVIVGFRYGSIKLYDLQTGEEIWCFAETHRPSISKLKITNDDKYIIVQTSDNITIFDVEAKQEVYSIKLMQEDRFFVSNDSKYLVIKSEPKAIDIWDIQMKRKIQQIKNDKEIHSKIAFSKNNDFIVFDEEGGNFKIIPTPFLETGRLNYTSSKIPSNLAVGDYTDILFKLTDSESRDKFISLYGEMYVTPYNWTMLHLLAIFQPSNVPTIEYKNFQKLFVVDTYGKTPLHYLLAQPNVNILQVNSMIDNINKYLEDKSVNASESRMITDSLSSLLPLILLKVPSRLSKKFLTLCYQETSRRYGESLPVFGDIEDNYQYTFSETSYMTPQTLERVYKKGDEQIMFRTNVLHLNYDPRSEDMSKAAQSLTAVEDIEIFKLPIVNNLIDHLWKTTKKMNVTVAVTYSLLMLLISAYIILDERTLFIEIPIIVLTSVFIMIELIQINALKEEYLTNIWNWVDMISLLLIMFFMYTQFTEIVNMLTDAWMVSAVITLGYLRWLSYLRLFSSTRHLIEIILVVIYDMRAFITMIFAILIAFSLIFLRFSEIQNDSRSYVSHFYDAYKLMFGNYDDTDFTFSQDLLVSVLLLILNVILLNLLISIIGDSHGRVQENRALVDAKARLEIIQDAMVLVKKFPLGVPSGLRKGYLVYCWPAQIDEGEEECVKWEGRMNEIKRMFYQVGAEVVGQAIEQKVEKEIAKVRTEVTEFKSDIKEEVVHIRKQIEELTKIMLANANK